MSLAVGTGGVPVYLPANGISGAPFATLFGRPVIPVEYAATLGTVGDVVLADLSQYGLLTKGGIKQASSLHVAFTTDEMAFRATYRVDGQPLWKSTLTPFKGSATQSPTITLATRS
jgi:HK97 family phage major capsid protein